MSVAIRNTIRPELERRARMIADKRSILEAMGLEFVSLSKRAFTDASLRPSAWAPLRPSTLARKKGTILRESGALFHSIAISDVTGNSVTVASDRPYAAIQQLGGKAGRGHAMTIPARPFFPILDGKLTPHAQERIEAVALAKIKSLTK